MEIRSYLPPFSRVVSALAEVDASSKLAIVCVFFGWFCMDTLIVTLGLLQHGVRFFDMSAVIADPARLFFGLDTPFHRGFFVLVCLVCLSALLAPHLLRKRVAWLGYLAPLALILSCGVLLDARTSGETFVVPSAAPSVSVGIIHFANQLMHRGSDLVSRHVSIGAGAYLALIGAVVLAVQGMRGFLLNRMPPRPL